MVKNTNGGNKSKNMARKNQAGKSDKRALRTSECELEKYGVVTQLNGHGMFYVITEDDLTLLGRIRSKFRGKSMRHNMVAKGSIVLVGLREWEAPNFKEADLLEVYDANEMKQLRKIPTIDMRALDRNIDALGISGPSAETDDAPDTSGIVFSADGDEDYMADVVDAGNTKAVPAPTGEELIDFDEI